MRSRDQILAKNLEAELVSFHKNVRRLPGIAKHDRREVFVKQLIESRHRVDYVSVTRSRDISTRRGDPADELFDPLKAAMLKQRCGEIDEAYWLVFLFVHFGKHGRGGWRYVREIYGRLGEGGRWDWEQTSANPAAFREWLHRCKSQIRQAGVPGGFGNHRKYQSLNALGSRGTGAAVETYVNWVAPPRTHDQLMQDAVNSASGDSRKAFDILFKSMNAVTEFGRTARFDYLAMIGKMHLAAIEPGSTYMNQATGPIDGARLLFGGKPDASLSAGELEKLIATLDQKLSLGMQVLEDALCNWQKSPSKFEAFRG